MQVVAVESERAVARSQRLDFEYEQNAAPRHHLRSLRWSDGDHQQSARVNRMHERRAATLRVRRKVAARDRANGDDTRIETKREHRDRERSLRIEREHDASSLARAHLLLFWNQVEFDRRDGSCRRRR